MHTLCAAIWGLRSLRYALMTSSSWPLSGGQPLSSKSTATCSAAGVEYRSVEMYCGLA
jgi:hypothetical protein